MTLPPMAPTANPAIVAAGSQRPSRSNTAVRTGQRDADRRGDARIVVVADGQSEVIERRQRVAVLSLKPRQTGRQL